MSARTTQQRTQDYPQAGKAAGDYGFHPLRVLVRRRWQLFACLVIVGSIAFASLFLSQPKYRAVAQVHVTERGAQQGKLSDLMGRGGRSGGDYFTTQCELLQSQYVLTRAAQRITEGGDAGASRNDTVEWMRDRIKIQPVPGSHLIDIIGIGSSAEEAAVVANGVMQAFVETAVTRQELNNTRIVERIRNQISDFDREVEKKKDSLNRFRQDHRIAGPEDSVSSAQARISQWQQDLHQTRTKRLELEPRQEQLRNLLRIDAAWTGGEDQWPEVQNDRTVLALQQKLDQLGQQEARLIQVYLPGHDRIREVRAQLADGQLRLVERKQTILQGLYEQMLQEHTSLARREQRLEAELQEQRNRALQLSRWEQDYKDMTADLETTYRFRGECVSRLRQFMLEQGMAEAPVVVMDEAQKPTRPAGLRPERRASSILLLGLLFSVVFILALDRFSSGASPGTSPSLVCNMPFFSEAGMNGPVMVWPAAPMGTGSNSPAEVKERPMSTTASGVLGRIEAIGLGGKSVDDVAFKARCQVVRGDQRCGEASSFRGIGTHLLHRFGDTQQSVVITSLSPQSGKTTCACNLALVLARSARKVVLVDIHPQGAALGRVFRDKGDRPDLSMVLADPSELDKALQETDTTNLKVLHCRSSDGWVHRTNMASLADLTRKLAQRFDWVIYDAGPLQAQLTGNLLHVVGKVLYIKAISDPQSSEEVVEQIERCGALSIGTVENTPLKTTTPVHQG